MRRCPGSVLCILIALLPAWSSVAAMAAGPHPSARKPAPAATRLVSLRLDPPSIALYGPLASQQLVVTGRYSDDSEADLTAAARFRLSAPGIARLDKDRVLPVANGGVTVAAQVGALAARSTIRVIDAKKPAPVSLANDIVPVFTRIGCNQGACHGQQNGQGGFKLSLRGYDPSLDYEQIVKAERADKSRRIDPKDPEKSLILLKPTMQVPHGGGPRITKGSPEYNLLLRWIREGARAPDDKVRFTGITVTPAERVMAKAGPAQRLLVTALYSDGSSRDVTTLARYQSQNDSVAGVDDAGVVTAKHPGESAIMVAYSGDVKVANILVPRPVPPIQTAGLPRSSVIDDFVYRKLARLRIPPSGPATDSEFLRRVYLDTVATLPTPEETLAFLYDKDPNRRAKLIDRLLDRAEFVDYRTLKLCDLLRVNGQYCSEEGADVFYRWIHDRVQQNVPYDQFVRELLTAKGSCFHVGPTNFFRIASNPEELAETTAQTFLGVRVQCAKCHNHPFERWKQSDYYGLAAFFARVGHKGGPEFGEEEIVARRDGDVQNPRTKQIASCKFLGGPEPALSPEEDRRAALAQWLTSKDNLDFARVAVNRVWAEYFGRGIVDAPDDFRVSNPPVNGPLLDALAKDFIAHDFDVKYITRLILNSQAYQRSSAILPGNVMDERNFARAYPRRIPAETLQDAIDQVTEKPERFGSYPLGWRAIQVRDSRIGNYFLEVFGRPKREILCACERSQGANLSQSLHLINSGSLNGKLAASDGRIAHLLKKCEKMDAHMGDTEIVDQFYLLALCRYPTRAESNKAVAYVEAAKDRRKGLEDVLWALLNSQEFLFNH